MRKICELIYLILAFRIIIFRRINTKYLLKCFLKHLYYSFINKDLINSKLNLSNNIKLYKKFFNTKINKFNILKNKKNNKIISNYILLRQQLKL